MIFRYLQNSIFYYYYINFTLFLPFWRSLTNKYKYKIKAKKSEEVIEVLFPPSRQTNRFDYFS